MSFNNAVSLLKRDNIPVDRNCWVVLTAHIIHRLPHSIHATAQTVKVRNIKLQTREKSSIPNRKYITLGIPVNKNVSLFVVTLCLGARSIIWGGKGEGDFSWHSFPLIWLHFFKLPIRALWSSTAWEGVNDSFVPTWILFLSRGFRFSSYIAGNTIPLPIWSVNFIMYSRKLSCEDLFRLQVAD